MADDKLGKLETFSAKVTKETKESLAELQASGDFATMNQLIETLIERYYAPIKAKDQSGKIAELEEEIKRLKEENAKISDVNDDCIKTLASFEELEIENEKLKENIKAILKERDQLEQDVINATVKGELPENGHIVKIDPFNYALLKYVADREGKARNQEWTIEDVINYFIHFRFEIGSLNGDLKSVPDSVVSKLKKELNQED